jgi:Ca2+-binding RTX toxin-like protein
LWQLPEIISSLQAQKDTLTGCSGNDAFVFNASFGKVVISDFDVNHDRLLINSSLFSNATSRQVLGDDSCAGAVIVVNSSDAITLMDFFSTGQSNCRPAIGEHEEIHSFT